MGFFCQSLVMTFVKLVIGGLLRLSVLYFSYNSSLVLGACERNFRLLHCHLGSPPQTLFNDGWYDGLGEEGSLGLCSWV